MTRSALIVLTTVATAAAVTILALVAFDDADPPAPVATITAERATSAPASTATPAIVRPTATTPPKPAPATTVSPAKMIGQKLMVGFRQQANPPAALLDAVRHGRVGGVILFSENNGAGRGYGSVAKRLQRAARAGGNPRLLIAIDQEGGDVRRIAAAPPSMAPREMGALGAAASREQGLLTGQDLRRRGITVNLAPVADVPDSPASFLGSRVFGSTPDVAGRGAAAFASGLQDAGVAATAKHYPGLGTTGARNTDEEVVRVDTRASELTRRATPFHRLAQEGARLVMVSNAIYTNLAATKPAVLSRKIVTSQLRRFFARGVVISDALEVPALRPYGAQVPVLASNAGVDILLYVGTDAGGAYGTMLAAHRDGRMSTRSLEASYERIMALKRWIARGS